PRDGARAILGPPLKPADIGPPTAPEEESPAAGQPSARSTQARHPPRAGTSPPHPAGCRNAPPAFTYKEAPWLLGDELELDAPVLRLALCGCVVCERLVGSQTQSADPLGRDSLTHEVRLDRVRPLLGELHIAVVIASVVGVPAHQDA